MKLYNIILLAPLFWMISLNCMFDAWEDRLITADQLQIQMLKDVVNALNEELNSKEADIKMLLDSIRLDRLMRLKFTRTIETQTDEGPYLMRRSQGSPDLTLEGR